MIVGLDLSLTSTGAAVLVPGQTPRLALMKSKPAGAGLVARHARLQQLVDEIAQFVLDTPEPAQRALNYRDATFYIEAPTYATHTGSQHDRSGLWWLVVQHILEFQGAAVEVSPTTVKAFATGRGNASKPEMMAATAQQFPGVPFQSDDDSDALWIAALGGYSQDPDGGRVSRTQYRDKAAGAVSRA